MAVPQRHFRVVLRAEELLGPDAVNCAGDERRRPRPPAGVALTRFFATKIRPRTRISLDAGRASAAGELLNSETDEPIGGAEVTISRLSGEIAAARRRG
jgi:hypothetical protein